VVNPASVADRRPASHNGAGDIFFALEHTPPSSSREQTTRSSARVRGGFLQNYLYIDGEGTTVVRALNLNTVPLYLSPFSQWYSGVF
jgi:hypothetical protein